MKNYILSLSLILACSSMMITHCYSSPSSPVDPKAEAMERVSSASAPLVALSSVPAPTAEKLLSPTEVVETLSKRGVELKQSIESLQTGNAGRMGALRCTLWTGQN
ncbi:hypothetical protein EQU50_01890 [Candidatus Finniella inopinata]|uniref:DUF3300 domain-containing protein n=1 Tax=Candidatus Finniella inopinata TaxID=1696036 RepID=A0A4Q7DND0_9PROT|nr:hypothetical protein EQU50_01890 [Candidatus Finniella inopinata]